MQAPEIRRAFLDMLVERGHVIIPRAPLVLRDDPTTLFTGSVMAGEFSVRKTSAGEAEPSWTIWFAVSMSLPLRTVTLMPVSLVKPFTHSSARLACWAL